MTLFSDGVLITVTIVAVSDGAVVPFFGDGVLARYYTAEVVSVGPLMALFSDGVLVTVAVVAVLDGAVEAVSVNGVLVTTAVGVVSVVA